VYASEDIDGYCFAEAGELYHVSPNLLWAISKHESNFNPVAVGWNSNGTYDYGVMQINSSWAKTLGKELWNDLSDPCTNIKTGAWILRQCIDTAGYNWKAVGCYNTGSTKKGMGYAKKIAAIIIANGLGDKR
jgi:soluble lytic murein transglycosylase-like protein